MRDPHVATLRYRLVPGQTVTFDRPPPVDRETETFRMRLEENMVTFEMIEHHASEESAKRKVEEYLLDWEIDMALKEGRREIRFEFDSADVIDRDPPPPGTGQVIQAQAALAGASALVATAHTTRRKYPEPPTRFVVSLEVETMWHCHEAYLEGRALLSSAAYACWTVLKGKARGIKAAEDRYGIGPKVRKKLCFLSSAVGDGGSARKCDMLKERRPHTPAEEAWLKAVVLKLIRRAGECEADPRASLSIISLTDLPKL